jgi:thioredoxin 2
VVQLPCAACGALNRVPADRLGDVPVCGRCQARLFGEHPAELDDAGFERFVSRSELPVLVDFWAAWCGPCRAIAPIVDQIAQEYDGRLKVGKVDTDANQMRAASLGVTSIPALFVFKNGEVVERIVGAVPKAKLVSRLEPHLA